MRFSFYLANEATTPGQLDVFLATFLHKLYSMDKRVLVRCPDAERAGRVSNVLWRIPSEGFLPHSTVNEDLPTDIQPVYLTAEKGNPNQADILMRLNGSSDNTEGFNEIIEFFGGLESEKEAARKRWVLAKETNTPRRLFMQEQGRWVLKQESE